MARTKTTSRTRKKSASTSEIQSTSITNYIEKLDQSSRRRRKQKGRELSDSGQENRSSSKSTIGIRKKKGLCVRNSTVQEETAGMKTKPQPKRKKPQPPATSSKANKSKRQKQEDIDDDQYTERTVSAQAASRWKPLSKTSKQYVLDTLDAAIVYVLNETSPSSYDDVQDTLNIMRQRVVGSLPGITVPSVRQPDYRQMEEQCHSMEVSVAEASNHVQLLENEIDNQLKRIEEKEQMIEELKSTSQTTNARKRIHPILQSTSAETLELPAVKPSNSKRKKVSAPSSTHHKNLIDILKKWQSQDSVKDMGTFMQSLSNVASTL